MDLVSNLVELNLIRTESEFGMGIGSKEYNFLFRYIEFLVSQDLANVDLGDCLVDWNDREMVPRFIAPLSSRGRGLVRLIVRRRTNYDLPAPCPALILFASHKNIFFKSF
jgi:hypothetical protein